MKRRYDQISNDEPPLQDGEGQYQAKRVHFEDSEREILRVTDLVDKESGDWVQALIDILEEQENGDREDKKRAKSQDWRSNKTEDYEITLEPPCPHNTLNGSKNLEECKCPSQKGFHKTALNTSLILLTYSNFKTLLERSVSKQVFP
ncbi:unnamed protein product [Moneuplotes crassus]|uniref:Uncharacterized protein n=1 Tax=Euplotes crassus TaxID=5936 RepID=A0AAD1X7R4_EUPCR|nr:unnamed protein product [Moneuplotes crassus]